MIKALEERQPTADERLREQLAELRADISLALATIKQLRRDKEHLRGLAERRFDRLAELEGKVAKLRDDGNLDAFFAELRVDLDI